MATVVGAFGVPHNPHFPTWVAQGDARGAEVQPLYGGVADALAAVDPDTLLVVTSDHYNAFWESLPIFQIPVCESARGPSDYPGLGVRDIALDFALARWLQRSLVAAEFDVGMSQEIELDHTIVAPLSFLDPDGRLPIVPVFVNAFIRPLPSARRCAALGRALRASIDAFDDDRRVAVVASGSFSLEIGGPRISETSHVGVPDPAWVERVVALLRAGDFQTIVDEATDDQLWRAGNAGGELLDWIVALATIDPGPPAFLDSQMAHGHAFGAWPR
jgi:protocatechuate 4,5-dioxygenase beta chain